MKREQFKNDKQHENGQALVLIVLAIVAIFGFAALAVDFGRVYAERRRVQNAADAAALAAGYAAGQSQDHVAAAIQQLRLNDVVDPNINTDDARPVEVEIYNPPDHGAYGPESGRPLEERNMYYQVIIHSAVDQVFSQFVYQGPLTVTVEAVVRVLAGGGLYEGDVLHALAPDQCGALRFSGNARTHLVGGGAYSDSLEDSGGDCREDPEPGHNQCASAVLEGTADVLIEGGGLTTSGSFRDTGSGTLSTDSGIAE